ncbi:hypothetical protein IHE45_09G079000 [Dioscorea alata]|uniref:Uncharacterized protein n=1 Tax=Dioscorea alata TaxID=55571 RepID=A0ACB7VG61_DIOAL|nr:hypothetical protein IHE45_09G079000 [Dioscorea alata]
MLLFTKEQREHINKCCKIMQEYNANSWMKFNHGCPPSPVTVIPMQTINIDINGFFKSSKP